MAGPRPRRAPGVLTKQVGSESILYKSTNEEIHVLNSTARLVWDLCDGEHTVEEIEQSIRKNFAVPPGYHLTEDILETLRVFSQKGLLIDPIA
jgi:hypothetical protein